MGTFDEAGDVGDDDPFVIHVEGSEVGGKGCERIIGNFRLSVGNGGENGGFARVGKPDQTDVGDQLELQS